MHRQEKKKLPIVDDDFNLKRSDHHQKILRSRSNNPLSAKDENGRLLCGAAVGITANVLERVDALVKAKVDVIVIDSVMDIPQISLKHCVRSKQNIRICR